MYLLSENLSEPHTRPELGLDVAGHDLQDSPCFKKIQKQLYLEPTQFWPPCCVMFTFLNPAITAGHGPSYLQDSTPPHAAHPSSDLAQTGKGAGHCWILVLASFTLLYLHAHSNAIQKYFSDLMGLPHEMKQAGAKWDWKQKQNKKSTFINYGEYLWERAGRLQCITVCIHPQGCRCLYSNLSWMLEEWCMCTV